MNQLRLACACLPLFLVSCSGDFPRDPDGTLKRVRAEGAYRVGLVAPLGAQEPKVGALLQRLGQAAGALPKLEQGDAEPLLNRLEEGDLDLVIGRVEKKSPWARLVTIGPPLRVEMHGKVEFHLAPIMPNGENAWIALVEKEARNLSPEAQ